MGPGVSRVGLSGNTPYVLTRPILVFKPVIPHQDAGKRTEPPVSVPTAHGTSPAATATPEPLLEPPGVLARWRSQGFHGVPRREFVPQPPMANSTVCVLPRTTIPCAISFFANVAVRVAQFDVKASLPPVTILPSSSIKSFNAIGTP